MPSLDHATAPKAGSRNALPLIGTAALLALLAGGIADAETLDAVAVENGRLVGDVNGRVISARDLIGTSFEDGAFTYSIVDATSDPFLPGLWRYRVTWTATGGHDWTPVCRNSRGSTGWAYAKASGDGPRFICEDTDIAQCLARTNGLSPQKAMALCLGE